MIKLLSKLLLIIILSSTVLLSSEFDDWLDDFDSNYQESISDPVEPVNRGVFNTYLWLYNNIGVYITKGYMSLPSYVRDRLVSFTSNLAEPVYFVNHVIQLKPNVATETLFRFTFNSTVGLFGLFDVATPLGLPAKKNDFGASAYIYGVGEGPYIFFFGPSNLRDTAGIIFNIATIDYYFPAGQTVRINSSVSCRSYLSCTQNKSSEYGGIAIEFPVAGIVTILEYAIIYEDNKYYISNSLDPYAFVRQTFTDLRREDLKKIEAYE